VQPGGLDHFLCYPATSEFSLPPAVRLTDQFGVHDPVTLPSTSPQMLCNPVDKTLLATGPGGPAGTTYPASNTGNPVNPDGHLYCFGDATYQPLDPSNSSVDPAGYDVQNQFGTFHVNPPLQPTQLCLPSWKYDPNDPGLVPGSVPPSASSSGSVWPDPSTLELNHFQCYSVNVPNTQQITVDLKDQFNNYTNVSVENAAQLCAPVIKQVYPATGGQPGPGSDINGDATMGAHLLCFNIVATPLSSGRGVLVGNQFSQPAVGAPVAAVPVNVAAEPVQLCVPSFKVPTTSTGTPEAPFALLLPIAGLAAGGSAFVVNRRRSLKGVS